MKYINLTLVITLATTVSSFATVRADDSVHGQVGIPTAAAEKDARDIMHTLGSGVEMAGHAVASSSEKIREATAKNRAELTSKSEVAKTQGQKDFEHLRQGVANGLADLRTKTENSGRQIASSFKGDNSESHNSNLPKEETRSQSFNDNTLGALFSEIGRNISQALDATENFLRDMGQKTRAQFAKSQNEGEHK